MNQNPSIRKLVRCGVVAAIYVVLCMALQPLSYGAVQVRVAEALCLLPVFGAEYIFGVVLGCQEPELFLTLFLAGQQTQQEAAAFHAAAMIKKVDMDKAQKAGDSLICPVVVDGSDPELMIHALWHISLQKGAPLPDCGIYYAALGRAVASQEEQRAILSNPAGYALCVVRLSPEVEKR